MDTTPPPRRHRLRVTIPPPSTLSTNWKRLQESLKAVGVDGARIKQEEGVDGEKVDGRCKRKRWDSELPRDRGESGDKDRVMQLVGGKRRKVDEISGKVKARQNGIVSQKQKPTTRDSTTKKMHEQVVGDDETPATTLIKGKSNSKLLAPSALAALAQDNPEGLARSNGVDIKSKPPPPTASKTTTVTITTTSSTTPLSLTIPPPPRGPVTLGKYLSLDCEMVACGPPPPNELSQLARVSIVNYHGLSILDTFVLPVSPVTDWRTPISGVRPSDMVNAIPFSTAREQVQTLLRGRILVGHALQNDLKALNLKHPRWDIRDTSQLEMLRKMYGNGRAPALRRLSKEVLGVEIQGGEHSSVVDARACMLVYRRFKREFEEESVRVYGKRRPGVEAPRVVVGAIGGEAEEEDGGDSDDEDSGEGGGGGEGGKKNGRRKKRNRNRKKKKKRKYK